MEMHIVPECYFDTVLAKNILAVKKVNHQHGCDSVIDEMTTSKRLKDDFAVGIIDNDKKVLKYIKEQYREEIRTPNLILLKHKTNKHYVIQLIPAIEKWVLNVIDETNIDLEGLNLPKDLHRLKKLTKYKFVEENKDVDDLCKRLIRSNGETISTLSRWLNYLFDTNRHADINRLKQNG